MYGILRTKKYYYQHRQREKRSLIHLFFLELIDYAERLDLYVEKLRENKESNRRNKKRFPYFRNKSFELRKRDNCVDLQENRFQFIRCWVKSRGNLNQRLQLNKLCFD